MVLPEPILARGHRFGLGARRSWEVGLHAVRPGLRWRWRESTNISAPADSDAVRLFELDELVCGSGQRTRCPAVSRAAAQPQRHVEHELASLPVRAGARIVAAGPSVETIRELRFRAAAPARTAVGVAVAMPATPLRRRGRTQTGGTVFAAGTVSIRPARRPSKAGNPHFRGHAGRLARRLAAIAERLNSTTRRIGCRG